MTGCEWCHTSVPSERWPRMTRLPDGREIPLCPACHTAGRVGDYSLDRYLGPDDPPIDD
jgi:NAD-dependent SIR2 family protein deacetylase